MIPLLVLLSLTLSINAAEKPWASRHAEGWAWYHDRPRQPKPEDKTQKTDPVTQLNAVKQELENALAKALLEPTQENVIEYMALQQKWVQQSALFSKSWQHALLEHPELASLFPTTQYGVKIRKEVEAESKIALIRKLAEKNTLLFFYEGESLYSKAFANIVREFVKQYNWPIQAVSVDNISLKTFPQSIKDRSIADEMGVSIFPSLFMIDLITRKAVPIAFGMITVNQIEDNILLQFAEER
jgi:conjugal transfer pilus assembly protein TraF